MIQGGSNDQTEIRAQIEAAYAEFGGAILRFTTRLCGNRDDAEDIVVETFVRAFQSWNEFHGTGSRRAWLFGIAHNATRMARRRRPRAEMQIPEEIEAPQGNAIEWIAIQQAVNELPSKQKESFLLVKGEGLTARESSLRLSCTERTVNYHLANAMGKLKVDNKMAAIQRACWIGAI